MPSDFGQAENLIRPLPLAKLYQAPDSCADGQFDDGAAGIKLILKRRERGGRRGVLISVTRLSVLRASESAFHN